MDHSNGFHCRIVCRYICKCSSLHLVYMSLVRGSHSYHHAGICSSLNGIDNQEHKNAFLNRCMQDLMNYSREIMRKLSTKRLRAMVKWQINPNLRETSLGCKRAVHFTIFSKAYLIYSYLLSINQLAALIK